MKITSLQVDGFGAWSGLRLDAFDQGVNVVFGPNEAGKSTLLQFIRSMFYGVTPGRRRFLPPLHGGEPGGAIHVAGAQGALEIRRRWQGEFDEIVVAAADGTQHGEHMLKVLLSEIDEAVFSNVFAIGLREIQELGTLSGMQAAELLYGLTAGLDRVSLVEVIGELTASRSRLLDSQGGPSRISQLLAERNRLRQEIEELAEGGRRFVRLAAERNQLAEEIGKLEEEATGAERELKAAELAAALWPRRRDWLAAQQELDTLGDASDLPDDLSARYENVRGRLRRRRAQLADLHGRRHALREQWRQQEGNAALRRQGPRIEAMLEQRPWLLHLLKQVAELADGADAAEAESVALRQRFGLGEATAGAAGRWSPKRLKAPARAMQHARALVRRRTEELDAARQENEQLIGQIRAALGSAAAAGGDGTTSERRDAPPELSTVLDQAGGRVGQLRRRLQIDERIDQLSRHQAELEEQTRGLLERQLLPGWVIAALGAPFVLGVTLVLASLLMSSSGVGAAGGVLAVIGLLGAGGAVAAKVWLERSQTRQLDDAQRQLTLLQGQLRQAQEERETLDARLPRGGGPLAARLAEAERQLAAIEELVPIESRANASRAEAESAARELAAARHEARAARRRWRDALATFGLPEELTPKQAMQAAAGSRQLAALGAQASKFDEQLRQRRGELEALGQRVAQLARDCGVELVDDDPELQLQAIVDAWREEQAAVAARSQLRREAAALRREHRKLMPSLARLKQLRRRLLAEAGAENDEALAALADQSARAALLRKQRDAAANEIAAAAEGICSVAALEEAWTGDKAERLPQRREALERRLEALRGELRRRAEHRGQVSEQLNQVRDDRRLEERRLQFGIVEERLQAAVQRWRVLAVAGRTLQRVRESYERDRQPESLREASRYLERMTEGRYCRVWTPLGEASLRIDDGDGRSLPIDVLSRGTREQLFLSLRLALAAWYARHGVQLPLVLDDVLVNFDARRAAAAAEVLRDFAAESRQLLVFTCHEHVLDLFARLDVAVCRLPDHHAEGGATVRFRRNSGGARRETPPREEATPREETAPPSEESPTRRSKRTGGRRRNETRVAAEKAEAAREEVVEISPESETLPENEAEPSSPPADAPRAGEAAEEQPVERVAKKKGEELVEEEPTAEEQTDQDDFFDDDFFDGDYVADADEHVA